MLLPTSPCRAAVGLLERAEQSIVFKPPITGLAEMKELCSQRASSRTLKVVEGLREQCLFVVDHRAEIDARWLGPRNIGEVIIRQQAIFQELRRTDQKRITCERGEALIRRVTVSGGSERQHLPQALCAGREKVDKSKRFVAEVPDAEWTRQRCRMQEDAARSLKVH